MRLSKLELFGFKSFADKTVLIFQPGITAIVGPNGCGKSNISDSFRWVLGEQSAKSLRGSKMMDVIFAGTEKRKPLNYAEVTLTFTDIDKPMSFSEVAVTRRLHRSGESEYFINKKSVRLKDIYDFFLDSGVGKDAFAIFEQGKIDQIINHSPLERRYIFEDAAGILRFLIRKKEAIRKLEQVDLNLSRVKDIHAEVEKQILVLEGQAVKAREYKEKKAQFEALEKGILSAKWHANFQKLGEIEKARGALECDKLVKELELEGDLLKNVKVSLEEMRRALQAKNQSVHDFKREIALIEQQLQSHKSRLQEMLLNEKKWLRNVEEMAKLREGRQQEMAQLIGAEKNLKDEVYDLEAKSREQRDLVKTLNGEVSSVRVSVQALEKERYQLLQSEKALESDVKQLSVRLEHSQEKRNHFDLNKKELEKGFEETLEKLQNQQAQHAKLEEELSKGKQLCQEMEKGLTSISEAILEKQKWLQIKQREVTEHQTRKNVLSRMREEKQGFSPASKLLLKEGKAIPLYEKISWSNDAAMATVMRPYAQTLVVETKAALEEVLSYAKNRELKDFSLICLEEIEDISHHFLGDALWTDEGIYIDGKGVLFYQTQGENHVFLREAELKKLEKQLAKEEAELVDAEKQLAESKEKQKNQTAEKKGQEEILRKIEFAAAEINFGLKRLKADQESKRAQLEKSESEAKNLSLAVQEFEVKIKAAKEKLLEIQVKALSTSGEYEKIQELLREKGKNQELQEKRLQELERKYREADEKLRKQQLALQVIEIKEQDSDKQTKLLEEEIKNGGQKQKIIEEQNRVFTEQRLLLQEGLGASEGGFKELQEKVRSAEQEIVLKERIIEEKRIQLKSFEEQGYQLGIQKAQIESLLGSLATELYERYQLKAEEVNFPLDSPLDKAERKWQRLRSEVANADQINMTAIEECERHKTRFTFLQEQLSDLSQAKQELVHIITDLDGQSRKVFKETFEAVRENFKKNFTILFHGGEADLQFCEAADVLEAGIEIVAMPPGKKMQSIQLLSGGEKCLTAMALLFAIFEVKPAPFCLLDEIDAPLDDANVERFMRLVKQYESRCQFLIVTHNKETMAAADMLFGVSMEEKGVSKVLAVEFAEEGSVSSLSASHSALIMG